jgi:2,3,4,5-tetrahydropyridine-2,6-dicarboxylate N-succinyltransferase
MTQQLQTIIDTAWENRANISIGSASAEIQDAVEHVIASLNNGQLRVASKQAVGQWTVHQWIKKAVLLSFRLKDNVVMQSGDLAFYDKVPTKFAHLSEAELKATGVRVVPPAVARRGSYIAKGAILMPSFVNIGAYVDEGTMVDAWATVGANRQTCAFVWWRGYWRRAGAHASWADDY